MISMNLAMAAGHIDAKIHGGDVHFYGCSIDSRSIQPQEMFIAIKGENHDGHDFVTTAAASHASCAMVARPMHDVMIPLIETTDTLQAMGRLAQLWRQQFTLPLIAITGSNGKTTVKEMLGTILNRLAPTLLTRGNLNNSVGVPLVLFGLSAEHRYAVIELGASAIGEIDYLTQLTKPTVAVITQCAPAHLEGFGSIDQVAAAKAEIYQNLTEDNAAVINANDTYADWWQQQCGNCRILRFGIDVDAEVTARNIRFNKHAGVQFELCYEDTVTPIVLPLPGKHNVMNALAAAACALLTGVSPLDIANGLSQVSAPAGRLCFCRGRAGGVIIDDTYNANPASLRAALSAFADCPAPRWLVIGDMNELGDESASLHRQSGKMIAKSSIQRVYALGDHTRHTMAAFTAIGAGEAQHFPDHENLIKVLQQDMEAYLQRYNKVPSLLFKGSRGMQMEHVLRPFLAEEKTATC